MATILLTGFEPFGPDAVNPSWEAVSRLPAEIGTARIVRRRLPVEYDRASLILEDTIRRERPDAVLCIGQAGGRSAITPEMLAINYDDAATPDNAGVQRSGISILPDGPAAYFATLPVKAIARAIRESGVPSAVSFTAGTFVCNHLMYCLLHLLARDFPAVPGGFIHVPFEAVQIADRPNVPALPLDKIVSALATAVRVTAAYLEGGCREAQGAEGRIC